MPVRDDEAGVLARVGEEMGRHTDMIDVYRSGTIRAQIIDMLTDEIEAGRGGDSGRARVGTRAEATLGAGWPDWRRAA